MKFNVYFHDTSFMSLDGPKNETDSTSIASDYISDWMFASAPEPAVADASATTEVSDMWLD